MKEVPLCKLTDLPKKMDPRGNLSVIEEQIHVPFEIKRTYWIYDVPGGVERGGHAFKRTEEFIVALSGSFDVQVNNGRTTETYSLNRSYFGLYVPKGLWRVMNNFSTNAVALIVASTDYDADDYIMDYEKYLQYVES